MEEASTLFSAAFVATAVFAISESANTGRSSLGYVNVLSDIFFDALFDTGERPIRESAAARSAAKSPIITLGPPRSLKHRLASVF